MGLLMSWEPKSVPTEREGADPLTFVNQKSLQASDTWLRFELSNVVKSTCVMWRERWPTEDKNLEIRFTFYSRGLWYL